MHATSLKSLLSITLLATAVGLAAPAVAADNDATIHQVYQAAEAGKFTEAQAMMDKVLQDHPNSATAHFIEAELLAKQGKYAPARVELATAERLAPGLPKQKPEAVRSLKALLAGQQGSSRPATYAQQPAAYQTQAQQQPQQHGFPFGWLIFGAALIAFIVFAVRFMARRAAAPSYTLNGGGPATYGNPQPQPQPPPYGYNGGPGATMGPMGGSGGGIGSGIMGGLATGAAVGAGMVAGEALMHHFTDGDRSGAGQVPAYTPVQQAPVNDVPYDDMGGNDFGSVDGSSWDDNSGGGSDDWN